MTYNLLPRFSTITTTSATAVAEVEQGQKLMFITFLILTMK